MKFFSISFFFLMLHGALNAQIASIPQERTVANENKLLKKPLIPQIKTTPIWGAGAPVGVTAGEFQNDIIQSTDGNLSSTEWTSISIYQTDDPSTGSTIQPGNAHWIRTLQGISSGAYAGSSPTPIASPSQLNGSAIFDSDFLDNEGIEAAFGTGVAPGPHSGGLTSPTIDLTGNENVNIAVNFFCQWRNFEASLLVEFSTDNGQTWGDAVFVNDLLPAGTNQTNEGWVSALFDTYGVTDLSQCRVRFVFDGNYYFAIIDDVYLSIAPVHDLLVGQVSPNTFYEGSDQVQFSNHRFVPISQLTENDFLFGVNLLNIGVSDFLPEDDGKVRIDIFKDVGGVWTNIHSDSIQIDTVYVENTENIFVNAITDYSWVDVGDYHVIYTIVSPNDENINNNTAEHYFSFTENDYISRVDRDSVGYPEHTGAMFPGGGGSYNEFEWGSIFQFANPVNDGIEIDSIVFAYYLSDQYSGPDQRVILVNVYEWEDQNNNFVLDDDTELTYLGIGVDTLEGLGTTHLPGTYGYSGVNTLFNPATGELFGNLSTDKKYYISLSYPPGILPFDFTSGIWFGDQEKNYSLNYALQLNYGFIPVSSPVKITAAGEQSNWYVSGFGLDSQPSIGIYLNMECIGPDANFGNIQTGNQFDFGDSSQTSTYITNWAWDFGDGSQTTEQNPTHIFSEDGSYEVCLIVKDFCDADTICELITLSTLNPGAEYFEEVKLYPIPLSEELNIYGLMETKDYRFQIINQLGQSVLTSEIINAVSTKLDLRQIPSGYYRVIIECDGQLNSHPVIVNN